jgi:DNA-binding MarR family transcriptional regulator
VGYSTFLAKVNTLEKHKLLEKKKIPMAGNRVYLKITNDGKKIVEKMKN